MPPRGLLRGRLELDRDPALWEHEHRIDPPAELRDVELKVDPGCGGGWWRGDLILNGRTQGGQLQPPSGLLRCSLGFQSGGRGPGMGRDATMTIEIREQDREDLQLGFRFYEEQAPGLRQHFLEYRMS